MFSLELGDDERGSEKLCPQLSDELKNDRDVGISKWRLIEITRGGCVNGGYTF